MFCFDCKFIAEQIPLKECIKCINCGDILTEFLGELNTKLDSKKNHPMRRFPNPFDMLIIEARRKFIERYPTTPVQELTPELINHMREVFGKFFVGCFLACRTSHSMKYLMNLFEYILNTNLDSEVWAYIHATSTSLRNENNL